jgi:hypothetical protein
MITVVGLTQSFSAASLKLNLRAATSKVRSAVSGSFLGAPRTGSEFHNHKFLFS